MKSIIENLERNVNNDKGLSIIDKRDDGFTYIIAIERGEETFVVYTTYGIQHYKKEKCWISFQVAKHIPFASVRPTMNGDFVSPYLGTVLKKGVRTGKELYGLQIEELPVFQRAS